MTAKRTIAIDVVASAITAAPSLRSPATRAACGRSLAGARSLAWGRARHTDASMRSPAARAACGRSLASLVLSATRDAVRALRLLAGGFGADRRPRHDGAGLDGDIAVGG